MQNGLGFLIENFPGPGVVLSLLPIILFFTCVLGADFTFDEEAASRLHRRCRTRTDIGEDDDEDGS